MVDSQSNQINQDQDASPEIVIQDADLPAPNYNPIIPPTSYSPMNYSGWSAVETSSSSLFAVYTSGNAWLNPIPFHYVKKHSDNKLWYKRVTDTGVIQQDWQLIPGQNNLYTNSAPAISFNPANLNQLRIWRIDSTTKQIQYILYTYNNTYNTWAWSNSWETMTCLGTTNYINISYPAGGNQVYVFTHGMNNLHTYATLISASTNSTNCIYNDMGGLTYGAPTSVYTAAGSNNIGLHVFVAGLDNTIYRNRNLGTNGLAPNSWSGWQQLLGPHSGYHSCGASTLQLKNCNYCLQYRDCITHKIYEECTNNGYCNSSSNNEPTNFISWNEILSAPLADTHPVATSYCSAISAPYYCWSGTTNKLLYTYSNPYIYLNKDSY
jgi:hypothetical protein